MFSFCCLQFCRLSFFPYVIKLALTAEVKYGGRIGQEVKKGAPALIDTKRPVGELNYPLVKLAGYTASALSCLNCVVMSQVE